MNTNNLYLLFLSVLYCYPSFAQHGRQYSKEHGDSLIGKAFVVDYKKEAKETVEKIVSYTGLAQNFQIVENPNIPTAIAYLRNKKRFIAYNPEFMIRVKDRTKSDWGAISVLAHEIGHHLSGHTLVKRNRNRQEENRQEELDADRFSGFIMNKMGASLEHAKSALSNLDLNSDPETHPPKTERLIAITIGWLEANKQEEGYFASDSLDKSILPLLSSEQDKLRKKPYVYKCIIYGDRNYYFVDEKNQVVTIDDYLQPYVVGYKVQSQDPGFDWIFSVQSMTYGVDSKGKMWSKTYAGDMIVVGRVYNIPR